MEQPLRQLTLTPPLTQGRLENEKVPLVQRGMASRSEARGIVYTSALSQKALDKIID